MKKSTLLAVMAALILVVAVVLVACKEHTHAYTEWKYDADEHWKVCPEDGAVDDSTREAHALSAQGSCVCGYTSDYVPLEIRVKGSYVTGWEHITTAEFTMTYDFQRSVYLYTHEFVAGDAFCFYNFETVNGQTGLGKININADKVDKQLSDVEHLDLQPSANIVTRDSGTYSFEYDATADKIVIKYDDTFTQGYVPGTVWYVAGGGITEPLKSSKFGNGLTDQQKLSPVAENSYRITLDLARGDMFQIVSGQWYGAAHSFSDIVEPNRGGENYFTQAGDNIRVEISGNYTLTLTLDTESPLGDRVEWTRNGDVIQELPVAFDVFMKNSVDGSDEWKISDRYTTEEGVVRIKAMLPAETQFCFIYYDIGVPDEEVGSYSNPGQLITGLMKGETGAYNANFSVFENNFVTEVAGFYTVEIDFNSGSPVVDFVDYIESVPEFQAIIKGNALACGWDGSDKYQSENGVVVIEFEVINTGAGSGELGFAWYDEDAPSYGYWIGIDRLGNSGDANSLFSGDNNFIASRQGKYRAVIDMTSGTPVVDIWLVEE